MKKLLLILLFVPLVSFGQTGEQKLELLIMKFEDVALEQNDMLLRLLKSGQLKLKYYENRFNTLKTKSYNVKSRLNKMKSQRLNLAKLPNNPEVRYYKNEFEFKIIYGWKNVTELYSFLIQ